MLQPSDRHCKSALIAALKARLGTAMGVRLPILKGLFGGKHALCLGFGWLALTVTALAAATWWSSGGAIPDNGHAKLASLTLWVIVYFAALIVVSREMTTRLIDIVCRDILPFASDAYAAAVTRNLARQPAFLRLQVPLGVAAITLAGALWAIAGEIDPVWWDARPFPADLLLWTGLAFYTLFASVRILVTAAFPHSFARALNHEREFIYLLDAANSPLIQGLSRLNRTLLGYWAIVFLVLLSIMLLALPAEPFGLQRNSPLLFILVPLWAFCSLGFNTLVYLGSEATIATAVRRYTLKAAAPLQECVNALAETADHTDAEAAARLERLERLERLRELHDRILAGGHYRSRAGTAVSLALPVVLPVIGLIDRLLG